MDKAIDTFENFLNHVDWKYYLAGVLSVFVCCIWCICCCCCIRQWCPSLYGSCNKLIPNKTTKSSFHSRHGSLNSSTSRNDESNENESNARTSYHNNININKKDISVRNRNNNYNNSNNNTNINNNFEIRIESSNSEYQNLQTESNGSEKIKSNYNSTSDVNYNYNKSIIDKKMQENIKYNFNSISDAITAFENIEPSYQVTHTNKTCTDKYNEIDRKEKKNIRDFFKEKEKKENDTMTQAQLQPIFDLNISGISYDTQVQQFVSKKYQQIGQLWIYNPTGLLKLDNKSQMYNFMFNFLYFFTPK